MISSCIIRLRPFIVAKSVTTSSIRCLHSTALANVQHGHDSSLSQGNVSKADSLHPGDVHDQAARSGQASKEKAPLDAASPESGKKASRAGLSGNPEGVGFAEQVGSASSTANGGPRASEGMTGSEESTPPGCLDSMKSKLGFQTTSGEVKQNRGRGEGVTGTGSFSGLKENKGQRKFHTSAMTCMPERTKGQAPEASRQPKDRTYSDQNEHLEHRSDTDAGASKEKGNAAEEPSLPSHAFNGNAKSPVSSRTFHTSALRFDTKHTAESYFKDVDDSPPQDAKTHQVDSSATGAQVTRGDDSDTGEFSRKGPQTKEYATTSKKQPYDTPPSEGKQTETKLRYGGTGGTGKHAGGESTSKPGEGPEGDSAGGRKPEGR
ncbi:uncharacterized protein FIBRA_01503 [Fibroporia radiculosa]|uniref:Uncharacterized protein n=1 Tax=Fibroporia radiculosa TaxID=599839 RepID=J4GKF3_9APHY|nr:uncharacterized protein FIBRA_01503 [Fibroporia radiculosa]CCL99485.1 predicted protein [Fibroporia radiculosa]